MPIESTQPIILPAPTLPAPSVQSAPTITLPDPAQSAAPAADNGGGQVGYDAQAAEQKRLEAVRQAAQDIANVYVVSDKVFTIFKDVTGQYITRFRSLQTGQVTYIPEPTLFKMNTAADVAPLIKITA